MIRFKEKEFEQWSICPATGDIFDVKTGEVQQLKLHNGRPCFKKMPVHQIMTHTFLGGYKPGYDVHHKDENPLNNALSNLIYLTHDEHARLHSGKHLSEETRLKIAKTLKGKYKDRPSPNKGKQLSAEHKAKLSAARKGKKLKPLSTETKAKISAARKGQHLSAEHKAKLSDVQKGKKLSVETCLKLSESHRGKKLSVETCLKIAESLKSKRWWNNGKIRMFSKECPGEGWVKGMGRRILNG